MTLATNVHTLPHYCYKIHERVNLLFLLGQVSWFLQGADSGCKQEQKKEGKKGKIDLKKCNVNLMKNRMETKIIMTIKNKCLHVQNIITTLCIHVHVHVL